MSIIHSVSHFKSSRDAAKPLDRVEDVRAAAEDFRKTMLANPKIKFYKTFELIRIPYPSKYGYLNAFDLLTPYVHICNKLFVIQFDSEEGLKTLLVSPSDWEHQRETPYFHQMVEDMGMFSKPVEKMIVKEVSTVLDAIKSIGLAPEDVDYITYDHLHTQNITRWFGGAEQSAIFPNAKLLVMREEWESTQALLPWQNQWYCPNGIEGVDESRVELIDGDVFLGDGSVALMHTKGHTEGNHSIVAHTDQGLLVTSENGISMDAYAPQHSKIKGLARYAELTQSEVVMNGNTLEFGVDQYLSMIQEKTVAGPYPKDERFFNMALSSESDGYYLFPGTDPTVRMGELEFGQFTPKTQTNSKRGGLWRKLVS